MKMLLARALARVIAIGVASMALASPAALAQQKTKLGPPDPGQVTKYLDQHAFDVGDVPGHQIRIATLHTKNSEAARSYDGIKVVESTEWLTSDYVNGSGRYTSYGVVTLANGDKFYTRAEGLTQTTIAADGTKKTSISTVSAITGGTGRFTALRGSTRSTGVTDFKSGAAVTSSDGEYWFDK